MRIYQYLLFSLLCLVVLALLMAMRLWLEKESRKRLGAKCHPNHILLQFGEFLVLFEGEARFVTATILKTMDSSNYYVILPILFFVKSENQHAYCFNLIYIHFLISIYLTSTDLPFRFVILSTS